MCARACGEMRQLLVRFGVSDGSFVAGGLPLPHLSPEPPPPTSSSCTGGRSAGAAGVSVLSFQLSSFPGRSGAAPVVEMPPAPVPASRLCRRGRRVAVSAEPGAAAAPPGAYQCPASPCAEPPSRVT